MSKLGIVAAYVAIVASGALLGTAAQAGYVKESPTYKVGKQKAIVTFGANQESDYTGMLAFKIDGKEHDLPPASTGFDSTLSWPRFLPDKTKTKIGALTFWQYDQKNSKRRKIVITFPDYKPQPKLNGAWTKHPGTDVVPEEPPK